MNDNKETKQEKYEVDSFSWSLINYIIDNVIDDFIKALDEIIKEDKEL